MSDPLGLSIGTTNLVAALVGHPPVTRRSVLTVSGQTLSGFVERVGDPVPLVAADGSRHLADDLVVTALDEMVGDSANQSAGQIAIAVPAHWNGATLRTLRTAMRAKPRLAPGGVPARLVSDAVAALTALHANPGLPTQGVIVLVDLGGGGTTLTLADPTASFEPIDTLRVPEFAGDHIDQALMTHVLDSITDTAGVDPAGTAAVGSLTALREECRRAKEALSETSSTTVAVTLPGHTSTVPLTRADLDALLAQPLAKVLTELEDLLQRNRIGWDDVTAVVSVGGGANIPLVNQRLSEIGPSSSVSTSQPALDAAVGAAVYAAYAADSDAQTGVAHAAVITEAINEAAPGSETFRALAWSQDEAVVDPVPYTGDNYVRDNPYVLDTGVTRAMAQYVPRAESRDPEPRAWQRLPQLVFGVAAVIALVAVGGVAIALTSTTENTPPTPTTAKVTATSTIPPATSALPPPTSEVPPPPPPVTQAPPSVVTVTNEAPPPPPPKTVTIERPPPKTTTTTTTQPTTTTTTVTTTTTPPTTTTTTTEPSPTMTTSYITVPFVPVPIPIQVPVTPTPTYQSPYYQQPPVYQQLPTYQQQPQFAN